MDYWLLNLQNWKKYGSFIPLALASSIELRRKIAILLFFKIFLKIYLGTSTYNQPSTTISYQAFPWPSPFCQDYTGWEMEEKLSWKRKGILKNTCCQASKFYVLFTTLKILEGKFLMYSFIFRIHNFIKHLAFLFTAKNHKQ